MKDLVYDKKIENNHLLIKSGKYFNGTFDGNNHTISGLNIKKANQNYVGLFSQAGGTIKNVTLSDSIINVDYYNENKEAESVCGVVAGGIVGYSNGKIEYCNVKSSVQIKGAVAGGIVGMSGNVSHCRNAGTVEGVAWDSSSYNGIRVVNIEFDDSPAGFAGGIVGIFADINYCCNYGTVIGYKAGGISGFSAQTIKNSCNLGNIIGKGTGSTESTEGEISIGGLSCVGGIVGWEGGGSVEDCYNLGRISAGGIAKFIEKNESDKIVKTSKVSSLVGGLIGVRIIENKIVNSYNAGNVFGENGGAITVCMLYMDNSAPVLKKCYYLEGTNAIAVNTKFALTEHLNELDLSSVSKSPLGTMLSPAFATELNGNAKAFGATSDVWEADTKGINKGFPILKDVPYDTSITLAMDTDLDTSGEMAESAHIYNDYSYTNTVSGSVIRVYANGAKVKTDGVTTNYKTCTLFTDITPSYIHTLNKNGTVKSSAGKVIVGITLSNSKPTPVKGKIVDKEATNIAKATIRNGQITITAGKQSGVVYLWVMDTGSVGAYESYLINVKGAPATLDLYQVDTNSNGFVYGTTKKYTKENVKVGESIKVYLYPYSKINGQAVKATSGGYTATIDKKATDYIAVEQDSDNPYCYVIYAKSLKAGKKVSGRVTFQCIQSGKKVSFTANVIPNS